MAKKTKTPGDSITIAAAYEATVTVPLADELPPNVTHRAHVNGHLKGEHGATLRRILTALNEGNHRLRDGRHVQSRVDAIKWLLENVASASR